MCLAISFGAGGAALDPDVDRRPPLQRPGLLCRMAEDPQPGARSPSAATSPGVR
jgi:hypothetical protein